MRSLVGISTFNVLLERLAAELDGSFYVLKWVIGIHGAFEVLGVDVGIQAIVVYVLDIEGVRILRGFHDVP